MSRIYTSENGELYANSIEKAPDGADVNGHEYTVGHGEHDFVLLRFQNGPVKEAGVNGLQNEQLIAVLVHRLGVLNKAFPCRENSIAITKLEEARLWLEKRTADRKARGVEGTNQA
jgi:hypothetical protein